MIHEQTIQEKYKELQKEYASLNDRYTHLRNRLAEFKKAQEEIIDGKPSYLIAQRLLDDDGTIKKTTIDIARHIRMSTTVPLIWMMAKDLEILASRCSEQRTEKL